jgi:hypothetical protein
MQKVTLVCPATLVSMLQVAGCHRSVWIELRRISSSDCDCGRGAQLGQSNCCHILDDRPQSLHSAHAACMIILSCHGNQCRPSCMQGLVGVLQLMARVFVEAHAMGWSPAASMSH